MFDCMSSAWRSRHTDEKPPPWHHPKCLESIRAQLLLCIHAHCVQSTAFRVEHPNCTSALLVRRPDVAQERCALGRSYERSFCRLRRANSTVGRLRLLPTVTVTATPGRGGHRLSRAVSNRVLQGDSLHRCYCTAHRTGERATGYNRCSTAATAGAAIQDCGSWRRSWHTQWRLPLQRASLRPCLSRMLKRAPGMLMRF